jgi:hypothetical protein
MIGPQAWTVVLAGEYTRAELVRNGGLLHSADF